MDGMTCARAVQLAGQEKLSGEVLAARWHVHHCADCQRTLAGILTEIAVLDDRLALQKLLDLDLEEAICQRTERVVTWLARGTRQVLAVVIRLSELTEPLTPALRPAMLGDTPVSTPQVIRQDASQTLDGSMTWKVTFVVDSTHPEQCWAEAEVSVYDRWDLAGIGVLLTWESEQRRGHTDERGLARFTDIPVDALGRINVVICPPHLPVNMNGPQ